MSTPNTEYKDMFNKTYKFNDPVRITAVIGTEEECTGRLVQVRKKCGAWGSDLYFLRRRDGSLMTFENVGLKEYTEDLPIYEDSPDEPYTVRGDYPETGFIIDCPSGPPAMDSTFSIVLKGE